LSTPISSRQKHTTASNAPPDLRNPTLSLHDALPIYRQAEEDAAENQQTDVRGEHDDHRADEEHQRKVDDHPSTADHLPCADVLRDRKSTRLNSSHVSISYAVCCSITKK